MTIKERISALRKQMENHKYKAYIIPSSDPHMSEITASRWMSRKWISGFTGSAGTVVITTDKGGLWTDGRYYIQATNQLKDSGIDLFKAREPGVPSYTDWLFEHLKEGDIVGIDGSVFDVTHVRNMKKKFSDKNISVEVHNDLIDKIWLDRPTIPNSKVTELDAYYAGLSRIQKFQIVRDEMIKIKGSTFVLSSLDDIAWLMNLRGEDVEYNPLFTAYVVIDEKNVYLFINPDKLDNVIKQHLINDGVLLKDYNEIENHLMNLESSDKVILNPGKTNYYLFNKIPESCKIIEKREITTDLKACKNDKEIEHLRKCCLQDSVSLVKWMHWLEKTLDQKEITELDAAAKLAEFRSKNAEFRGVSFNSISAYGDNAAMMHYAPTLEKQSNLKKSGFYLIDSGGQYNIGTTDVTRTLALGNINEEQKEHFTRVLRGVINLSRAKFLKGTTGANLDMLSRQPLWEIGIDYKCGTGHGIGFFLNVHEGPQNFSQSMVNIAFKPGMVTSVEPGVYLENRYGIRTENMILCVEAGKTESGEWLAFDTLTWVPIDIRAIEPKHLTESEKEWINNYHQQVFVKLSPWLNDEEKNYLSAMTREI